MQLYEARFFTHGDEVFGSAKFEADDDNDAKDHANRHLRFRIGRGHEIWLGDRLIHREIYE